jgi:hypothetical protein
LICVSGNEAARGRLHADHAVGRLGTGGAEQCADHWGDAVFESMAERGAWAAGVHVCVWDGESAGGSGAGEGAAVWVGGVVAGLNAHEKNYHRTAFFSNCPNCPARSGSGAVATAARYWTCNRNGSPGDSW